MKKRLAIIFAFVMVVSAILFSGTALAAHTKTTNYYDAQGNRISINGMYYDSNGYPMYNSRCYYTDANGNTVYVGGCRAYYYNANGKLVAGNYYYNTNGKAVSRPTSYPGGWGCGSYCYNTQGNVVNGTYYYDDFGNPVTPQSSAPQVNAPSTNQGRCGGWCW